MPEGCSQDFFQSDPLWDILEVMEVMERGDQALREEGRKAKVAESFIRGCLSFHNRCPRRKIAPRT